MTPSFQIAERVPSQSPNWIQYLDFRHLGRWQSFQAQYLTLNLNSATKGRVEIIDTIRGLLLYWMIVSHAIHQAGVATDHPLQWLRPFAWMSSSFAMVTGLSLAVIYANRPFKAWSGSLKIWARAKDLFLIAFISNAASVAWRDKSFASAWSSTLFENQWSISQYLLPTIAMLILAPLLIILSKKIKPIQLFIVMIAIVATVDGGLALVGSNLAQHSFFGATVEGNGVLNVSISNFLTASFFAFGLGIAIKKGTTGGQTISVWTMLIGFSLIFLFNQSWFKNELLSGIHMGYESLLAISRFIISAQLAILITRLRMFPVFQGFYKLLATLGQNSLLIFILHRPFCHIVGGILGKTVENQYIVVLIGAAITMGIMWSICQLRKKFEFMHTGLAKIGF